MIEARPTVTDYVLMPDDYGTLDGQSTRPVTHIESPVRVHGDIWISGIDHQFAEAIFDACEPKGEGYDRPVRQFGWAYAVYRQNAPADRDQFDDDGALFRAIAVSRLVHPTSIGFETAARVRRWRSGRRQIIPALRSGWSPSAYVMMPNENRLIPDDVPAWGNLIEALYAAIPLSRRLEAALWHHEAVARHYFIDLRWPLLTTCLEALVRIRDERLTAGRGAGKYAGSLKVFLDRLCAIGRLDSQLAVDPAQLRKMYDRRSIVIHGLAYGQLGKSDRAVYSAQERLVRGIVRKALLEPDFRAIFASDETVRTYLPLR